MLGSMLELGREAEKAHEQVAHQVITLKIDLFFLFGQEMEAAFEVLKQKGFKGHYFWTDRFETLLESLKDTVKTGDLLLIKGSRGVELERLVEPLLRSAA